MCKYPDYPSWTHAGKGKEESWIFGSPQTTARHVTAPPTLHRLPSFPGGTTQREREKEISITVSSLSRTTFPPGPEPDSSRFWAEPNIHDWQQRLSALTPLPVRETSRQDCHGMSCYAMPRGLLLVQDLRNRLIMRWHCVHAYPAQHTCLYPPSAGVASLLRHVDMLRGDGIRICDMPFARGVPRADSLRRSVS